MQLIYSCTWSWIDDHACSVHVHMYLYDIKLQAVGRPVGYTQYIHCDCECVSIASSSIQLARIFPLLLVFLLLTGVRGNWMICLEWLLELWISSTSLLMCQRRTFSLAYGEEECAVVIFSFAFAALRVTENLIKEGHLNSTDLIANSAKSMQDLFPGRGFLLPIRCGR